MTAKRDYRLFTEEVPMGDGVKLATDVYLPGESVDSWPTILIRTPYDRTGEALVGVAEYFTGAGYAVVIQDVRGRYSSAGEFEPFVNEADDGRDCIAWVGEQAWCDGRVGTIGTSYLAQTQASMAITDPPYLASQYISQGYCSYHRSRSRRGGAFENHRLNWLLRMAATSPEASKDPVLRDALEEMRAGLMDWIREGYPVRPGLTPLSHLPSYERTLMNYMTRGQLDEFWANPGVNLEPYFDDYKDVPVTWLGSWYDGYTLETPRLYQELSRRLQSPQRLIMGPWIHGMGAEGRTFSGDVDFGEEAVFASLAERRRWFDHTLKGEDNGADGDEPVRIFVMGGGTGRRLSDGRMDHGGTWRDEKDWPLARARDTDHYLHPDGTLSLEGAAGEHPPLTYDFDPRDPVPSTSAAGQTIFESGGGGYDQRQDPTTGVGSSRLPLSARRDVLVFRTAPLSENTEITGPIEVVLWVSSSAPDTDFTVKLIDEYPPNADYPHGYALELSYTLQRCRYRNGYDSEEMMTLGEVYELRFPLPPTSNLFGTGHRIRIDVSSSNWPKYEVNPNTGEPVGRHRCLQVATNSLFCDGQHPSRVVLPVIPRA